jgi:hypothetical protein
MKYNIPLLDFAICTFPSIFTNLYSVLLGVARVVGRSVKHEHSANILRILHFHLVLIVNNFVSAIETA